jgi:adenosylcobinamide-GDP ribazoletransferase
VTPLAAVRSALTLFTVVPVHSEPLDRRTAGATMLAAPAAGLVTAVLAAGVVATLRLLIDKDESQFILMAVAGIAALSVASRGLHLDGLADTTDALGSYRDPEGALAIMRKGDVGPFGVASIVVTLLLQMAGLHACLQVHRSTEGLLVAGTTGLLAATWACVGVPAARSTGLGATVAGSVGRRAAWAATAAVVAFAGLAGGIDEASGLQGALRAIAAMAVGLLLAWVFRRHAVRRLGGITGDVFGALVEIALTSSLIAVAVIG